jgi:hypothetical protein
MEEQPHESPNEQPSESSGEQPKFFKGMNGLIAGATALLIALGGLATTWDKIFGDKPGEEQPAATAPAEPEKLSSEASPATGAQAPSQSNARPKVYTGDLYADGKFEGGAMSLKHDGENWILTADQRYVYLPLASSDKDKIRAYNADYASHLRWPVNGGEVEEKLGDKPGWDPYAKVTASEPSPAN